jgi:chemotaxis protein CheC
MIQLNDMQRDALGELFNLGVGRAAHSLSQIVRDEVELSAPVVSLMPASEVADVLLGADMRQISMVSLDFSGPFDARSMLIFPERNALTIVSHMLDAGMSPEEMAEFEQEAMCEVGNIILNACVSALADHFRIEFEGGLPEHHFGDSRSLDLFGEVDESQAILILRITLAIRHERIEGHMLFLLSVGSLNALLARVDAFLAEQGML